jgi:Xaa-Pro aminopeptidase
MREAGLRAIQAALTEEGLDAWLFADFRGSDPIAARVLGLGATLATRRWFYCIPATGEPTGLVSGVEPDALRDLPGRMIVYRTWQELHAGVTRLLAGARAVAMQYSPRNDVPYIARVDAGTVELVRSVGVDVRTSADLVQRFEAVWSAEQFDSHARAAHAVREVVAAAFAEIGAGCRAGRPADESSIQRGILDAFAARGLVTHHPPIVAAGPHSADPHYATPAAGGRPLGAGEFVLIDLWAKEPGGVYADITWTGYVGAEVPARHAEVFGVVRAARDAGVDTAREALANGAAIRGCDVDAAVRSVIEGAGFGAYFVHRTGHSIGVEVHGNGANIDGFETPDTRRLLPGTCFSIEPGVYLPGEFGVRSELNAFVDGRALIVTGQPVQTAVVAILGDLI